MKASIILESKDVKKIISKFLEIDESQVIQNKYSYSIVDINIDDIQSKLHD